MKTRLKGLGGFVIYYLSLSRKRRRKYNRQIEKGADWDRKPTKKRQY